MGIKSLSLDFKGMGTVNVSIPIHGNGGCIYSICQSLFFPEALANGIAAIGFGDATNPELAA